MKQWILVIALLSGLGLSACDWNNNRDDEGERSVFNQDGDDDNRQSGNRGHDRDDDD